MVMMPGELFDGARGPFAFLWWQLIRACYSTRTYSSYGIRVLYPIPGTDCTRREARPWRNVIDKVLRAARTQRTPSVYDVSYLLSHLFNKKYF